MAAFAVQGFASLAYEVIWTRVFAVMLDGTTYAFSIVLAVVLLGIAVGSAVMSPLLARRVDWVRIYALIQTGVALYSVIGIFVIAHIFGITNVVARIPFLT